MGAVVAVVDVIVEEKGAFEKWRDPSNTVRVIRATDCLYISMDGSIKGWE